MVRSEFVRGRQAFVCEISGDTDDYLVRVTPEWDEASTVVECFENPVAAFGRYAEVAWHLRQAGFVIGPRQAPRRHYN